MQAIPPSATGWLPIILAIVGGVLGTGGAVAIFNAVINRRRPRAEIENAQADTALKRAQAGKTMAEMLGTVTDELKDALKNQHDTTKRMRAMQEQIDAMCTKCLRLEAIEQELKMANAQIERARRAGFLQRDREGGVGPNPAVGGPSEGWGE